jgi:hypothetical protein
MSPVATLWRKPSAPGHFGRVSATMNAEEQDDPEHPQRQVGQRLGIGEAELGADEAR